MSGRLAWRDNNYTNEEGATRHLSKLFSAGVIGSGSIAVTQRGAGANMSVDVAAGESFLDSGLGYWYPGWNNAVKNIPLNAADPSNPRRTLIVEYVNLSISDLANNNAPTAWELKAVDGTPAASPSDPSAPTIQASVGSGNPYRVVARIAVGTGVTSIVNANITDLRTFATLGSFLIPDSGVVTAKINDNAVTGSKLATNAILLGCVEKTTTQGSITSEVDLTGLSVTVTVPAGGRDLEIIGRSAISCTSTAIGNLAIKEGATYLGSHQIWIGNTTNPFSVTCITRVSAPSAGSHTYKLAMNVGAGTGTQYADSSAFKSFIMAKMI